MVNKEILFKDNVVLKILSYDAKQEKLFFEYNNNISSMNTAFFIKLNYEKIKKHFECILFKYKIGDRIIDDRRDLLVIDRFNYNKKKLYKVKCNICGYVRVVDEIVLKEHDYSCSCCNGKVVIEGVNDIPTTDPWMIPYFQGGYDEAKLYTSGSNSRLYFICPYCNRLHDKAIPISSLASRKRLNCVCMDYISYPEKFMRNYLRENNIDYIYQAGKENFNWCKNYLYDFYIPDKNIIIETHGEQHYIGSFNKKTLENQKEIDKEKECLAKDNGFKYVVVDCRKSEAEYIYQQIKISGLPMLLNIHKEKIDLQQLDEKCRNNYVKEICIDYNSDKILPKDLAKKYNLDVTTIYKYLHIGTKIGWCNYDSKLNLKLGQEKTVKIMSNKKRLIFGNILVFDKNNCLIGEFENQYEASEQLKNNGITISVSSIGNALKRENHKSKGLFFYYENELKEGVMCK